MEPSPQEGSYNTEYMQRVYQSLLKTGNNISLAELNTHESSLDAAGQSNLLSAANQSQIRQTVKIIQSNGAGASIQRQASVGGTTPAGSVSLLHKKQGVSAFSARDRRNHSWFPKMPDIIGARHGKSKESSILGYRKKPPGNSKPRRILGGNPKDPYYQKWRYLKKYVKNMAFMNAAICDEVVRQEEKVAKAREERRFLLRKLLQYQAAPELPAINTSILKSPGGEELTGGSKSKAKKKANPPSGNRQTKEMLESMGIKSKPKKSKLSGGKHIVPPIPLDSIGRPMFPLVVGDLTVYSIGEIVHDRGGFHTSNSIFPVGYCSTRIYANTQNPDRQCLYTCKISDGGNGPMFEIVPEDDTKVYKSRFLSECHSQLLRAINQSRGTQVVTTTGKGAEFFGLVHPVVQNLIQSCPGAKKCSGYKWVKFEVNKALTLDRIPIPTDDPTISHTGLKLKLAGTLDPTSSSLRNLLSGALKDGSKLKS